MHIIGFSHHYTKLWGQTHGILLSVRILSKKQFLSFLHGDGSGRRYDTEWRDKDARFAELSHFAEIQEDECVQLVFIGNRQIPFTTYRKFPKDWSVDIHGTPYADLCGKPFAFKFKGEKLPHEFASRITAESVKIFE